MKMKKLKLEMGFLFLLISAFHSAHALDRLPKHLLRVELSDYQRQMQWIHAQAFDLAGVNLRERHVDLLVSDDEEKVIKNNGLKAIAVTSPDDKSTLDTRYQNPTKVESTLKQLAAAYPGLAQLSSIGKSLQGRDIWAMRLTKNVAQDDASKPHVFFNAMHHAREVMTSEVGLDIIQTLLSNYGKDKTITHWLDSYVVDVIPMFNVDGNNLVWTTDKMWRKNARGGYGVDINRNYPYAWNSCHGSSSYQAAQDYHGPSAASEPETQLMMRYVKSIHPVFSISYHSFSEIVIYPFGCPGQHTPTQEVVEKIGKDLASRLVTDDQKGRYTAGTAPELLYAVDGGDIDWYYSQQVIPYVIEMNSTHLGFQPDYTQWRNKTVIAQRQGWGYLLARMDGPSIYGQIKGQNGVALENAVLQIKSKNSAFVENYKVNPKGYFNVILNPGSYQLTVQAPGFASLQQDLMLGNSRQLTNLALKSAH